MELQRIAALAIVLWTIVVRFRKSGIVLLGGGGVIGLTVLAASAVGKITWASIGLSGAMSPLAAALWAIGWLAVMLALNPVADWIAARLQPTPPDLQAFKALQESRLKLVLGIAFAWIAGGFAEELLLRGVFLNTIDQLSRPFAGTIGAAGLSIAAAAGCAYVLHLYQGPRAALIIAQLSVLFGLLFVLSGRVLWPVVLCHGLYDTVAFIRFATKRSKYAVFNG